MHFGSMLILTVGSCMLMLGLYMLTMGSCMLMVGHAC